MDTPESRYQMGRDDEDRILQIAVGLLPHHDYHLGRAFEDATRQWLKLLGDYEPTDASPHGRQIAQLGNGDTLWLARAGGSWLFTAVEEP